MDDDGDRAESAEMIESNYPFDYFGKQEAQQRHPTESQRNPHGYGNDRPSST